MVEMKVQKQRSSVNRYHSFEEVKKTPVAAVVVEEKKRTVVGHKYFVKYGGPQQHLSISPGIGKVEIGKEYPVSEEMYYSLKGLTGWTVRTEEVLGQK